MPFAIQSLLILLAPILFAASVYMFLGRVIGAAHGEQYSLIRLKWLTKLFVAGDVLCFCIQGAGGGLLSTAKKQSDITLGDNVILGGLVLQVVIFLFFIVTAVIWHVRMKSHMAASGQITGFSWEKSLYNLYIVSVLITVRNAMRCGEYAGGQGGYLLANEWVMYVFDALLMAFVLGICLLWYNNRALNSERLNSARDSQNEEMVERSI